jgi:hypothetical protein
MQRDVLCSGVTKFLAPKAMTAPNRNYERYRNNLLYFRQKFKNTSGHKAFVLRLKYIIHFANPLTAPLVETAALVQPSYALGAV